MSEEVEDEEAARLGAAGCSAGCVAAPIFLFVLLVAWAIFELLANPPEQRGAPLPPGLALGAMIHSETSQGWRKGCDFLAFDLPEQTAAEIERRGLAYFAAMVRTGEGDRLAPWRETPIAVRALESDPGVFVRIGAAGEIILPGAGPWTCGEGAETLPRFRAARRAVEQPGAYYASFADGAGLIFVIPAERLAIYLYLS